MTGFTPDLQTRVTVKVHSENIDNAISRLEADPYLSQCGSIMEVLNDKKEQLQSKEQPIAEAIAERLKSNQEIIISTKHFITGEMAGNVEIMSDGSDYIVGNTATSVDGFPYPLAIEKGRRAVYPVEKKVLRWFEGGIGGTPVYSKYSSAVPADPFIEPSINQTLTDIEEIVNSQLQGI